MTWNPTITEEQFTAAYAERSGLSVDQLAAHRVARPCGCGERGCEGWMMVNPETYDEDLEAWRSGDGPHPGRLG